jgi:ribonuclease R
VLLDRIDRPARRLQFALVPTEVPLTQTPRKPRKPKAAKAAVRETFSSPTRTGKPGRTKSKAKARAGKAKSKGKRR